MNEQHLENQLKLGLRDLVADSHPSPTLIASVTGRAGARARRQRLVLAAAGTLIGVTGIWTVSSLDSTSTLQTRPQIVADPPRSPDLTRIAYVTQKPTTRDIQRSLAALALLGSDYSQGTLEHLVSPTGEFEGTRATFLRRTGGSVRVSWFTPRSFTPPVGKAPAISVVPALEGADNTKSTMAAAGSTRVIVLESPTRGRYPLGDGAEDAARSLIRILE